MQELANEIYSLHEKLTDQEPRFHLGASEIGHKCERALWYSFRWAFKVKKEGKLLRLFETGNLEEARIINELRLLGYQVLDREDGRQIRFTEDGGHFSGSVDGKIFINGKWYILECKTINKKGFQYLKENGVKKAQYKHYAQMQTYMRKFKIPQSLYVSLCKDNEEFYIEVVCYNEKEALSLKEKALRVINDVSGPSRISEKIEGCFECTYCDYQKACHKLSSEQLPELNCRTCMFSTPEPDGSWSCTEKRPEIKDQKGCEKHLFLFSVVPGHFQGKEEDPFRLIFKTIEGKTLINEMGKGLKVK